ncbi:hypothetical protein CBR_g31745 [Chara braunii]|uniref:Peptidase S8/S53 domain-containing protein n=1 Tax=Chara braunii TaxID=69332 RepID=A0A388JY74_CHABU|nr:hypothetical protein CBR_g31745 [Chara braunii]|eukprot:GBG62728.1 hypothetical protein CBR_g31745 [Chara braunii]
MWLRMMYCGQRGDIVSEFKPRGGTRALEKREVTSTNTSTVRVKALSSERILVSNVMYANLVRVVRVLIRRREVVRVSPMLKIQMHNRWASAQIQGDNCNDTEIVYKNLIYGTNQLLALSDTGIDMNHCFFYDPNGSPTPEVNMTLRKVVKYKNIADEEDVPGGHGTHVAGTLIGSPYLRSDGEAIVDGMAGEYPTSSFSGIARDAKLGFQKITLKELYGDSVASGASIHSNSWGIEVDRNMIYDELARDVDDIMYRNENFLLVFSAGNAGKLGLNTVTSPGTAKNCLTVGASLSTQESFEFCQEYCQPVCDSCRTYKMDARRNDTNNVFLAPFSSKGPTLDARIKPDIVAPGMRIWSANAGTGCGLKSDQGTSMSSPVVAATGALVRQYFTDGFYPSGQRNASEGFVPSSALIKACLIHSARGLLGYVDGTAGNVYLQFKNDTAFPNSFIGWGLIRIDRLLKFVNGTEYSPPSLFVKSGSIDGAVIQMGETHVYTIQVLSNSTSLRATMVWMDPPAAVGAVNPMLHDLDLSIVDVRGQTTYPNGLMQPDRLNNVERVVIGYPSPGIYEVHVAAVTLTRTYKNQSYALVITGDLNETATTFTLGTVKVVQRPPSECFLSDPLCEDGICQPTSTGACPELSGTIAENSGTTNASVPLSYTHDLQSAQLASASDTSDPSEPAPKSKPMPTDGASTTGGVSLASNALLLVAVTIALLLSC